MDQGGGDVDRPRAADDFATIRARMEELRQEGERPKRAKKKRAPQPVPVGRSRIGHSLANHRLTN